MWDYEKRLIIASAAVLLISENGTEFRGIWVNDEVIIVPRLEGGYPEKCSLIYRNDIITDSEKYSFSKNSFPVTLRSIDVQSDYFEALSVTSANPSVDFPPNAREYTLLRAKEQFPELIIMSLKDQETLTNLGNDLSQAFAYCLIIENSEEVPKDFSQNSEEVPKDSTIYRDEMATVYFPGAIIGVFTGLPISIRILPSGKGCICFGYRCHFMGMIISDGEEGKMTQSLCIPIGDVVEFILSKG